MYGLARTRAPRCGRPLDYTHTADRSWPRLDSRQTYYWVRVTLCYIAIALHVYVAAASARPRLRDQFAYVLRTRAPIREGVRLVTCTGSFTNGIYTLVDRSFGCLTRSPRTTRFCVERCTSGYRKYIFSYVFLSFSDDAFFHWVFWLKFCNYLRNLM